MALGPLAPASQTLSPLTPNLRHGLTAITVLAFISFFSATLLFLYLSYKLVWHLYLRPMGPTNVEDHSSDAQVRTQQGRSLQNKLDFALGIDGIFTDDGEHDNVKRGGEGVKRGSRSHSLGGQGVSPSKNNQHAARRGVNGGWSRNPPNQFLILIFNLLLADMHQGVAFFLNAEWLRLDAVEVDSPTCFVQGLFISTGDLASSMFITTIAVHTYLSIVRGYMPPHRLLYASIAAIWVFVYGISAIPIGATSNGAEYGGFFVRAGAWCWMNIEYRNMRLLTHYLFIFIAIAITSGLYLAIFIHLRRRASRMNQPAISKPVLNSASVTAELQLSHNPAFLIYPVIYILCTLPLAVGRIASMTGAEVPLGYLCFAGAMIASNGSFDCLLFGTTRNVIVFASKHQVDRSATGLDTFNFMQTPHTRKFGNMVWVQGGENLPSTPEDNTAGGWWSWKRLGGGGGAYDSETATSRGLRKGGSKSGSQESLHHPPAHIQMDTITTVVVEVDRDADRDPRYPQPSASASASVNSTDKEYQRGL